MSIRITDSFSVRLIENDIRRPTRALPDSPVLLETRIGMMVVAAEILCIGDQTDPIYDKIARLGRGINHDPRRSPCIRSLAKPTRFTRNTQTGSRGRSQSDLVAGGDKKVGEGA